MHMLKTKVQPHRRATARLETLQTDSVTLVRLSHEEEKMIPEHPTQGAEHSTTKALPRSSNLSIVGDPRLRELTALRLEAESLLHEGALRRLRAHQRRWKQRIASNTTPATSPVAAPDVPEEPPQLTDAPPNNGSAHHVQPRYAPRPTMAAPENTDVGVDDSAQRRNHD